MVHAVAAALVASLPLLTACGDSDGEAPHHDGTAGAPSGPGGCTVKAPTACVEPAPTYDDVAPIFEQRCVVCHSGVPNGPWPLTTYAHVATWRDTVRAVLVTCAMPPADAGFTLPAEESEQILAWIRCGMPR